MTFEVLARRYRRVSLGSSIGSWLILAWGLPALVPRGSPAPLAILLLLHWSGFAVAPWVGYAAARRAIRRIPIDPESWILCGKGPTWSTSRWRWYAPWMGLTLLLPVMSYAGYLALPVIAALWFAYLVFWVTECAHDARSVAVLRRVCIDYRSQAWSLETEDGARSVVLASVDPARSEVTVDAGPQVAAVTWSVAGPIDSIESPGGRLPG